MLYLQYNFWKKVMITVTNLSKTIHNSSISQKLFCDISWSFEQNNSYIITGASGIGKSTFLSIIAGFDTPTKGIVVFDKKNIHTMTTKEQSTFRTNTIGFLFQKSYLMTEISVLENVMLPILLSGKTEHEAEKQDASPSQLSGGQQQRVSLARAVVNDPLFLYADEPTAFLDQETGIFIIEWIFEYISRNKSGLIMNSHDQSTYRYTNNILVLKNQKLESLEMQNI